MAKYLTDEEKKKAVKVYNSIDINFNTVVPKGAMQTPSIFKDQDGGLFVVSEIRKSEDEEKRELHSIWLHLNVTDSQGYIVTDESVRDNAMIKFMAEGDKVVKFTHGKDENGNPIDIDGFVKELYVVPEGHPIWKDEKYVGDVAGVIKIEDEEMWNLIKEEKWETSIEGRGTSVMLKKDDGWSIVKTIKDLVAPVRKDNAISLVKENIGKDKTKFVEVVKDLATELENQDNNDYWNLFYLTMDGISMDLWNQESYPQGEDKKKVILDNIEQLKSKIESMSFVVKENNTEEDVNKENVIEFLKSEESTELFKEESLVEVLEKAGFVILKENEEVLDKSVKEGLDSKITELEKTIEEKDEAIRELEKGISGVGNPEGDEPQPIKKTKYDISKSPIFG